MDRKYHPQGAWAYDVYEFGDSKSPKVLPKLSPWQHVDQAANKIMATWGLTWTSGDMGSLQEPISQLARLTQIACPLLRILVLHYK